MVWELMAYNTDGRYPHDIRYRGYTSSKEVADLFQRIPKIQFSDSGHGIVFQAWAHKGRRKPIVTDLCEYVREETLKLAEAAKPDKPKKPRIVCLCGSTRFSDAFREAQLRETLGGKIVLTIGCNMKSDTEIFGHLPEDELQRIKTKLDELHLRKIDLADEVLILNVGGYIGQSTHNELQYARAHKKLVRYLETDSFGIPLDYIPDGGTR